jgi:hypothetical protein
MIRNTKKIVITAWLLIVCFNYLIAQSSKVLIITTSGTEYKQRPATSIYPAFVDGTSYQSWTEEGPKPFFQLQVSGGKPPYKWKIIDGQLPKGITLSPSGRLAGTPAAESNFLFTVKVTDSQGNSSIKKLDFPTEPFRSKWMADAKFGVMIQWGPFVEPILSSKEEISIFEKRITKFDADKWAQTVVDLGGKVLNFTVKGGDGIRLWPSTTKSRFELKTQRNIVSELIMACHKKGIRFVAYFAPDHNWNKKVNDVGVDGSWGTLNKGLIKELVKLGVDGFWIDMGATPELYKNVDPKWFPWDEIIPIMRTNNPYVIFANNPGLGNGGTILRWPHTDVVVYEGRMDFGEQSLVTAKPVTVKKKLAIEVDNLLDNQWGWIPSKGIPHTPKPASLIIKNIKENWAVGATYMLNYPVPTDGDIMPDAYKSTLAEIGTFVKANSSVVEMPVVSVKGSGNLTSPLTISLKGQKNARIHYTTDGSEPDAKSKVYTSPIRLTKSTIIKAITVLNGQNVSNKLVETYSFKTPKNHLAEKTLLSSKTEDGNDQLKKESNDYYRGMRITVKRSPIVLKSIGRKFVKGNKGNHRILIKRYSDDYPVYTLTLTASSENVSADGFQYMDVPSLRLEKGISYIIVSQEGSEDLFAGSDCKENLKNKEVNINGRFILSSTGDRASVQDDGLGSILNLKYDVIKDEVSKNIALGSSAKLLDNNDKDLKPVRNAMYAENAVDGDKSTNAQAGGKYAWTLQLDLGKVIDRISKATLTFGKESFATHFVLLTSTDNINWITSFEKNDNDKSELTINFNPVKVRYVKLRSLKPDGPNQTGNQMGVMDIALYP